MKLSKKFALTILSCLFVVGCIAVPSSIAQAPTEVQIRSKVQEIGTGTAAKVEGSLRNGTKFKGIIESVAADSFLVVDSTTGISQTVEFANVAAIKKQRNGLKPRTWIIIGAAAAAAIIVGKTVLYPVLCDGGAGC